MALRHYVASTEYKALLFLFMTGKAHW